MVRQELYNADDQTIIIVHKIICFNNTCIYAECDDGVMLIQLIEEQNAADLKELRPILKYRLQLRSKDGQPTADST